MSKLRERLYKDYKLEEIGYDFMGYPFNTKKELSTHHIIPRHSGGETKKNNLCVLNRITSHNYIHLIEDFDYKTFLEISRCLMEQVKLGKISIGELNIINDILCSFEYKYKDAEAKHGGILIKPEYKKRIILTMEDNNGNN
jgi:hypothetical protein